MQPYDMKTEYDFSVNVYKDMLVEREIRISDLMEELVKLTNPFAPKEEKPEEEKPKKKEKKEVKEKASDKKPINKFSQRRSTDPPKSTQTSPTPPSPPPN